MAKKIVIDPITRIEGHLRIECEVDGGKVTNAWSSGQMWRGIEVILLGQGPPGRSHLHPANLRGLNYRTRLDLGEVNRKRPEYRSALERPVHPQHDDGGPRHS